jgi:hypothetical protein
MSNPETQFKPGQSGNPNGRPKKGDSWADILNEAMDELIESEDFQNKVSCKKAIAKVLAKRALKGDVKAIETIMERQEGKAKQTVDNNTNFTFNFEDESDAEI